MSVTVYAPSTCVLQSRVQVVAAMLVMAAGLAAPSMSYGETPSYTAAQAERGAALYADACAKCHGENVDGGEFGPPLKGPPHIAYWAGKTAKDMFDHIKDFMPPTQPGLLGAQGNADVMAFLLKVNAAPPGEKEIPADGAGLSALKPVK